MPLPKRLARFNRQATNRVAGRFAGALPPLAVVVHRGRNSGKKHRTPVLAFKTWGGYAIALTYGPDTDWRRNVSAAGGCTLERAGRRQRLTDPQLLGPEGLAHLPLPMRWGVRLLRATHVLVLRAPDGPPQL